MGETSSSKDVWIYHKSVKGEQIKADDPIPNQNGWIIDSENTLSDRGVAVCEIEIAIGDKVKTSEFIRGIELTEEEKGKAKEIALSDLKVKVIIAGKNYELKTGGIVELRLNERGEAEPGGASVAFAFEDGTIYFVHVDLEKGEVVRISPPILPPQSMGILRAERVKG